MNLNPMEQFAIKPIFGLDKPLLHIGSHPIFFTNQALLMVIVASASALFLSLAVKPNRLVPTRAQSNSAAGHSAASFREAGITPRATHATWTTCISTPGADPTAFRAAASSSPSLPRGSTGSPQKRK